MFVIEITIQNRGGNLSYKVGDVVIVRKDLILGEEYDECNVAGDMPTLCGKTTTITWANGTGKRRRYKIRGNTWFWSNSMFDGLANDLNCEPISLDVFSVL